MGAFIVALVLAVLIVMKGPSRNAAELFTMSLRETSALYWIPNIFFSEEELQKIVDNNTVKASDEETDTEMIDTTDTTNQEIEIFEISGPTYIGDVMLIHDPSRVFVGNKGEYDGSGGTTVDVIAERYGAIGGINGGGFYDLNGQGNGGLPDGFVISEGGLCYQDDGTPHAAIGFTEDNKMIIGFYSYYDAQEMGLRDCVCVQTVYAPILIVNGEEQEVSGAGGGLNPRTAIGQAADGTIIFVTTDGRQANSVGATFSDMIKIMSDYGAVNAASLDGGSSTQMVYYGEFLNTPYALSGAREVPNAFLVRE
ncbi:MAG: phosphodiester glycosidase family protein [Lachnospiraceae bacterium]|nr:phosphodiester glycosidase family protein [Lachnospiraceae bacterium]